ncbi:DNA repair ATPase [Sphaerisporangium dianthi]|uniref:DNA repair ATPase n=1 Tax=Sphaerisporangium dianthi TaxID=1436120 RepID=A0ABV9CHV4_9ACTN
MTGLLTGPQDATLDAGAYEVLRTRLAEQAAELGRRAEALNTERLGVFGGAELRLAGAERIRTRNNCVPRDIVAVGGLMLFGYNVFVGMRPETAVEDVFSLHRFVREGEAFRFEDAGAQGLAGLLDDPRFRRDFAELYRYYRETRLLRLRQAEGRLLAVFQTGPRTQDVRVLRWSLAPDGAVSYLDDRGERDDVLPASHDFAWTATTRDDHVPGRHPHISIGGEVFVETVGGDLTIKVEDNTETGEGIYREPVDEPLQSLADADVQHARVGPLILLRVRPYKEERWRHLVYDTRTRAVARLDGIGQACRRLPEDQGIIFPGGYHLATGVTKTFDADVAGLEYEREVRSPNGEDVLFVFHARAEGRSLLLPYNLIRKEVAGPITCHGYSLFEDGTLVVFREVSGEPSRVHPMQVWRTPYQSDAHAAVRPAGTGPLERVGNADLVRGISDALSISRMAGGTSPSAAVFEALVAACERMADHYHWLGDAELGDLRTPLAAVRTAAGQALEEFEQVRALTERAAATLEEAAGRVASMVRRLRGEAPGTAGEWVARLAELRQARGRLVTVREMRYADQARADELAAGLADELDAAAGRAVEFLRGEDAFAGYHADVERLAAEAGTVATAAGAAPIGRRLDDQAEGLEVLTEVVGGLDIADATVRTAILERIGEVLAGVNRARAVLTGRRSELLAAEGRARFAAEFSLLGQAATGAIAMADTPERCDEQLGRLLLRLETLESRFGEFDDFLARLTAKREEVVEAFTSRRHALLDERTRKAGRLAASSGRILAGVRRRAAALASLDEVNAYFAADPMVAKLRAVSADLRALGDPVRAEELDGRLKAARQEAGRALRDRLDLYGADGRTIRLGAHRFSVDTRPFDLTLVPHDGAPAFAITGTDYLSPVRDEDFAATRPFWDQTLVSETPQVYRAEHLAASILADAEAGREGLSPEALRTAAVTEGGLLAVVRRVAASRLDEGYERGVHDHDAAAILAVLLRLRADAGLLRHPPRERAAAQLFWAFGADEASRGAWSTRAGSLARARAAFGAAGPSRAAGELCAELADAMAGFFRRTGPIAGDADLGVAAEYLFEELAEARDGFVTGAGARALLARFRAALGGPESPACRRFEDDVRALGDDLAARHQLVRAWLGALPAAAAHEPAEDEPAEDEPAEDEPAEDEPAEDEPAEDEPAEAVAIELCGDALRRHDSSAVLAATVEGLLGTHPRVVGRRLRLRIDEFMARTRRFRLERVPAFRAYQRRREELVARERARLRLSEYEPKVMSAFVRNRLLDEVYLPLIGANLAKQLGAAGETRRTDQMGLLLLISPPGYGKTTLMEYVASRLGLVFVKVDGPALGSGVTSLDPARAPDATARREVEKISFALEMGSNVLLYLDDIQHTSPELLQRFISLCDAQRRMEGVWDGAARTYDLRGKRFAVCMAGNPYTESGGRFRIPDMLANRADVWNLGDVLSGREELFALSYIENALTSNPVLAPLAARDGDDLASLLDLARGGQAVRPDRLAHPYSAAELDQITSVLRKLLRVRQVVLAANQAYIASASQSDASRTEPPFRLQGSYRNMNKLAERVVPVMNDAELDAVIDDHYLGEAQTLAGAAEANLLKLAELRGTMTPEQARRWAEVKAGHVRAAALGGEEGDPVSRAVGAVGLLADRVGAVESAIERAARLLTADDLG